MGSAGPAKLMLLRSPPFMQRSQLLDIHDHLTHRAFDVMQKKNHDYAAQADPFFNLRQCEAFGLCSVEQGILVRMTDKISRLSQFVKNRELKVADESIEDTLVDLVNYAVLLRAYLADKNPTACASKKSE